MADDQEQPTWGQLGEAAKFVGKSLTALPRLSMKIATGEIPKDAGLPEIVKGMAPGPVAGPTPQQIYETKEKAMNRNNPYYKNVDNSGLTKEPLP